MSMSIPKLVLLKFLQHFTKHDILIKVKYIHITMYLLFDIGGTNMRLAISSDGKTVSEPTIVPTPPDFQDGLKTIKNIAGQLTGGQKIEGVAGGIAGPLDKGKTMLVKSPHIGEWINKPLKVELETIFKVPVFLENDANLGGLGEATAGAGIGYSIVAYLTVSTGVGGVRLVNGKIDENSLGFEPGHQIIIPEGNLCQCGGKGHLEAYVGGFYLEKIYGQKAEKLHDSAIWDQVAKYLAIGLNNATVHWSPNIIVLGGSVMDSIPLQKVRTYLQEFLTIFPDCPETTLSKHGDLAGLYGALSLLHPFLQIT